MTKIQQPTVETKQQAELRRKREALAEAEENERRADAVGRRILTQCLFWEICGWKRCRRARACMGEPESCLNNFGKLVSEELKVELRASMTASRMGLPPHEVAQYAEQEVAYHRLVEARRRAESPLE